MKARLGFGLRFGLLVERRELGEEARRRGFNVLNKLRETEVLGY